MKAAPRAGALLAALFGALLGAAGCTEQSLDARRLHPPEQVHASGIDHGGISVRWSAVEGATSYAVYTASGETVVPGGATRRTRQTGTEWETYPVEGVHAIVVTAFQGTRESEPSTMVRPTAFEPPHVDEDTPLLLAGTDSASLFGFALAAGDVNGDGYDDLVVGAPEADGGSGAVALYFGGPDGLSTTSSLEENGASGEQLGWSVAMGDTDGTGFATILAGAPGALGGSGRIRWWVGGPQGPSGEGSSRDGGTDEGLGRSVSVVGDVDGVPGREVAATVGSDSVGYEIRIFGGDDLAGTARNTIDFAGGAPMSPSVVDAGDHDGDGVPDVLVGIPGWEDLGGPENHGIVRLFSLADPGPAGAPIWETQGDAAENVELGAGAIIGDFGGETGRDLLLCAPGQNERGVVHRWRFDEEDGGWEMDGPNRWMEGDTAGARFCHAISLAGTTGERSNKFFVSSPGDEGGLVELFSFRYDFQRHGRLRAPAPDTDFGVSLASGDFDGNGVRDIAVGAPRHGTTGGVYVYRTNQRYGPRPDAGGTLRLAPGERFAPAEATFQDPALRRHWRCTWTFGDGSVPVVLDPCTPADVSTVRHEYEAPGTYGLVLRVERVEDGYVGEASTLAYVE